VTCPDQNGQHPTREPQGVSPARLQDAVLTLGACSTVLLKRADVLLLGHNLDESVDFCRLCLCQQARRVQGGIDLGGFPNLRSAFAVPAWLDLPIRFGHLEQSRARPARWGRQRSGSGHRRNVARRPSLPLGRPPSAALPDAMDSVSLGPLQHRGQVIESASSFSRMDGPGTSLWRTSRELCRPRVHREHARLHTGTNLPVTALCNAPYAEELDQLNNTRALAADGAWTSTTERNTPVLCGRRTCCAISIPRATLRPSITRSPCW